MIYIYISSIFKKGKFQKVVYIYTDFVLRQKKQPTPRQKLPIFAIKLEKTKKGFFYKLSFSFFFKNSDSIFF